jgi:hypothetical protein
MTSIKEKRILNKLRVMGIIRFGDVERGTDCVKIRAVEIRNKRSALLLIRYQIEE